MNVIGNVQSQKIGKSNNLGMSLGAREPMGRLDKIVFTHICSREEVGYEK